MMFVPPTSWLFRFMPGIRVAAVNCVRPVGRPVRTSWLSVLCLLPLCTSTIGDSPETVMVSSTEPTFSSALTVAANDPASSMPSRLTVLKPGQGNVTL